MDKTSRVYLAIPVLLTGLALAAPIMAQQGDRPERGDRQGRGDRRGPGGPGGFGGPGGGLGDSLGLLQAPEVRKALKITEEEEAYIGILNEEFRDQDREFFESMRDSDQDDRREKMREHTTKRQAEVNTKLEEIIGADRNKRLKEIRLQVSGAMALFAPDVSAELKITEDQRNQVQETMRAGFAEMMQAGRDNPEGREARFEEFRKVQSEKVLAILTPEQKSQWEKMKGEPIDFKLPPPSFGRGRGPRGPRGGPDGAPPEKKSDG